MKTLVTGAGGRLGPFIVDALEKAGHEVVQFSRKPIPGKRRTVIGDITVFEDCMRALDGRFDAVHHAAAQPWPVDHPGRRDHAAELGIPFDATMKSNIMGTYYLLRAMVLREVGIIIMTGSNCALGHGYRISNRPFPIEYLPIDERHPSDVEDSYSFSKLTGEELLASYSKAYGIRAYTLRSAGICNAERRAKMRENARPASGWDSWLSAWVGSEDIARAHVLLMEKAAGIEPCGTYFCNAEDTTALEPTMELVERFRPELLSVTAEIPGHGTLLSNEKLKKTVGWRHETAWRE